MKCVFLIALFLFAAQEVFMLSGYNIDPANCPSRLCVAEYKPVCGMQKVGDCWDVKIFNNSCLMDGANDCGAANYVPCVENQCGVQVEEH